MLAAPLFHVHPEADHRHGEVGHVHGGTVHTVWSPDLDCEYDNHGQAVGGHAQLAHSGDGHPEFGLSLLTDSTDRKSLKPFLAQAFGFLSVAASDVERSVGIVWNTVSVQPSVPSLHTRSPRAPPSLRV
jgi:hypothetical protein